MTDDRDSNDPKAGPEGEAGPDSAGPDSADLDYRQLGADGNPFDRGRPDFSPPDAPESQDGGRPDANPSALVDDTLVPDETAMQPEPDRNDTNDASGDADEDDDVLGDVLPSGKAVKDAGHPDGRSAPGPPLP